MDDITKTRKNLGHFEKRKEIVFVSLYYDRNIHDAILTG